MTNFIRNQKGSTHIVAIAGVLIIAVVAFAGYRVLNANGADNAASSTASHSAKAPDAIKSAADVKKADKALDSTAIDGSVNPNQLDSDLNALL